MKTKNDSNALQVDPSLYPDRQSEEIHPKHITREEELVPPSVEITNHNAFERNGFVNGVNQFNGAGWTNTTIHSSPIVYPLEKVCELYERIINEKDRRLQNLEKRVAELEKKVGLLLKK